MRTIKNIRRFFTVFAISMTMVTCSPMRVELPESRSLPYGVSAASLFKPPQLSEWKLDNGLTVLMLPDHELPLVQGVLFVKGGTLWEDGLPHGSIGAMGDQMRRGGAGNYSADSLDYELEKLAANISTGFATEYGVLHFSALSTDVDRILALSSDVLLRPRFENERLSLWKGQSLEGIRRRVDNPETIAGLAFHELLYGDSPYGRVQTSEDIKKISKENLIKAHEKMVVPNDAILAVSGNFDPAELKPIISKYFSAWKPRSGTLPPPPPVDANPKVGVYFISQPLQQSSVILGHLGVPRLTPDYVSIEGFNEIFSGGFASRLFAHIRTELGLSYNIGGGIQAGTVKGINSVGFQTKVETTGKAVTEVFKVISNLKVEAPSNDEVQDMKRSVENSFIFKFSTTERMVERAALIRILGYPKDYDEQHLQKVRGIEPKDIQQVAQNRWRLNDILIVVVGDERAYSALEAEKRAGAPYLSNLPLIKASFDEKLRLPNE